MNPWHCSLLICLLSLKMSWQGWCSLAFDCDLTLVSHCNGQGVVDCAQRIAREEGVKIPSCQGRQTRRISHDKIHKILYLIDLIKHCVYTAKVLLHYVVQVSTIFYPIPPVPVMDLVSKTQVAAFWRGSMPFVTRACLVGATQVRIWWGEGIEWYHTKCFASCKLWLSRVTHKTQAVSICFLLLSSLASAVPSHCLRPNSAHGQKKSSYEE